MLHKDLFAEAASLESQFPGIIDLARLAGEPALIQIAIDAGDELQRISESLKQKCLDYLEYSQLPTSTVTFYRSYKLIILNNKVLRILKRKSLTVT